METLENNSAYADIILSGAIDARNGQSIYSKLKGVANSTGQTTLFTEEILINSDGYYNQIKTEPAGNAVIETYDLINVLDNSNLEIQSGNLYGGTTSNAQILNGTYTYLNGGYKFWTARLNKISFAFIQNLINNGYPDITYNRRLLILCHLIIYIRCALKINPM